MPAKPALVAPNPVSPTPRSGAGPSRLDSLAEPTGFGLCLETALTPGSAAPVAPVAARPPQEKQLDGSSPESRQPSGKPPEQPVGARPEAKAAIPASTGPVSPTRLAEATATPLPGLETKLDAPVGPKNARESAPTTRQKPKTPADAADPVAHGEAEPGVSVLPVPVMTVPALPPPAATTRAGTSDPAPSDSEKSGAKPAAPRTVGPVPGPSSHPRQAATETPPRPRSEAAALTANPVPPGAATLDIADRGADGGLGLAPSSPTSPSQQAGTARSASASPERDLSPARPAEQIAPVLVSLSRSTGPNGDAKLTLRLDPLELGRVQIQIERPNEAPAKVDITVDRRETLTLLLRDQHELQRALDQAGVPAGRTLSFHLVGQDQPPAGVSAGGNTSSNHGNQSDGNASGYPSLEGGTADRHRSAGGSARRARRRSGDEGRDTTGSVSMVPKPSRRISTGLDITA